jgi:hypothetical protein
VAIYRQTDDRGLIAHVLSVLEIEDEQIVAIHAFIDPRVAEAVRVPRRPGTRATVVAT